MDSSDDKTVRAMHAGMTTEWLAIEG